MRTPTSPLAPITLVLLFACNAQDTCIHSGTETLAFPIYGGSRKGGNSGLGSGHVRAVVSLLEPLSQRFVCTGILINRDAAVTAAHCNATAGSEVRVSGGRNGTTHVVNKVERFIGADVSLLHLTEAVEGDLEFFSLAGPASGVTLVGRSADVAGRGLNGSTAWTGDLLFIESIIEKVDENAIRVRGAVEGTGACFGDSGGPLLDRDSLGQVRWLGLLSKGSASCVGTDTFVPSWSIVEWLQELNIEIGRPLNSCAGVGDVGFCTNGEVVSCDHGRAVSEHCDEGKVCTWNLAKGSYGCVPRAMDPCAGENELGSCSGSILRRCVKGVRTESNCEACNLSCERMAIIGSFACQ